MKNRKPQAMFSVKDPLGAACNTDINFWNHIAKTGFVHDEKAKKFYPRGKAYWKMLDLQLEGYGWGPEDGE